MYVCMYKCVCVEIMQKRGQPTHILVFSDYDFLQHLHIHLHLNICFSIKNLRVSTHMLTYISTIYVQIISTFTNHTNTNLLLLYAHACDGIFMNRHQYMHIYAYVCILCKCMYSHKCLCVYI